MLQLAMTNPIIAANLTTVKPASPTDDDVSPWAGGSSMRRGSARLRSVRGFLGPWHSLCSSKTLTSWRTCARLSAESSNAP